MKRSMGIAMVGAVMLGGGQALAQDPAAGPAAPPVQPAPAATSTAAAAAVPAAPDAAAFNRELGAVEERVDDLKERVFRSKAALLYLREVVATGSTGGGARVSIQLRNKLGAGHVLEGVTFFLDGQIKYTGNDTADKVLRSDNGLEVLQQSLSPGTHDLTVTYRIRSTGFNVFSYAKKDTYEVRVRNSFEAKMGEACVLVATVREGAAVNSFKDRTGVDFNWNCGPDAVGR